MLPYYYYYCLSSSLSYNMDNSCKFNFQVPFFIHVNYSCCNTIPFAIFYTSTVYAGLCSSYCKTYKEIHTKKKT